MEETREMEQEIQQESDSFDTGLLERMNRIYEEREREYQKFYDQIRSREEELERIGTTLAVQKEEQEKKEAHLQEFEQSLKVIQERLEQRTDQLKQEEEALEQLTAEQRDQLEKEYQKLKQSKANAEIKQQIEINDTRTETVRRIANPAQFGFDTQQSAQQSVGRHAVTVQSEHLVGEPGLILAALRFGTVH